MSEYDDASFRDKPDMAMIWLRHMDRTNLASGNVEGIYDPYVRQQLRLLPSNMQLWVLTQEDEYTEEKEVFEYEYRWGRRRGYEHNPVLYDDLIPLKRLTDGAIDWDDPNIRSPKRKNKKIYDYEKFNLYIMLAAEKSGISWQTELKLVDGGDTLEQIERRRKTPFRKYRPKEEKPVVEEEGDN